MATFETHLATPEDAARWIADDLVVVLDARDGASSAGRRQGPTRTGTSYYDGVREATLYVARESRRAGAGRALLDRSRRGRCGRTGAHKLVGKVFTSNEPSIALRRRRSAGARSASTDATATLDGEWKDVLVVEKLLDRTE